MPFKIVTLKEWKAMGLTTETSTIHLGNSGLVRKIKEHQKKIKKQRGDNER